MPVGNFDLAQACPRECEMPQGMRLCRHMRTERAVEKVSGVESLRFLTIFTMDN
jgi:hypothetical protein